MKVIDLLNKIANGEEGDLSTYFIFDKEKYNFFQFSKEYAIDINSLNWEIKIVEDLFKEDLFKEDKKIEKLDQTLNRLDINDDYYRYIMENRFKINEIIDKLNEMENK